MTNVVWPAYWTEGEWKVLSAFAVFVSIIISPVLASWWNRKGSVVESRARIEEMEREQKERFARERYATIERERDYALQRVRDIERDREALIADRDRGWDLARAIEDWAHAARHRHASTIMLHNAMREYLHRVYLDAISKQTIDLILQSTPELPEPEPVPRLRDLINQQLQDKPAAQRGAD